MTDAPNHNPISRMPFDSDSLERIAEALGGHLQRAPFQLPGGTVYQLTLEADDGRPSTMVTLWPTISRVDAISSGAVAVFTGVTTVDIVGTVEVQFRRTSNELLIVARGGRIIVRS